MIFNDIKTPEELMTYLDEHFEYGVIDSLGNIHNNSDSDEFQFVCETQWKLRSVNKMLTDGIGHCYDQVEIEREWFTKNGYEIKTFWISAYQVEIDNSGFSHTYLIYRDNNKWKLFEHADFFNKGIYTFNSIKDAVLWQAKRQIKSAEKCIKPINKYVICIKEYTKPEENLNMQEYLDYIDNSKDFNI